MTDPNPKPYAVTDPITGKTTCYTTLAGAYRAFDALKVKPKGKPWPGEAGYVPEPAPRGAKEK